MSKNLFHWPKWACGRALSLMTSKKKLPAYVYIKKKKSYSWINSYPNILNANIN